MTAHTPDEGLGEERDGTPFVPEDVWLLFLTDSERAIRASAPVEPSARQRAAVRRSVPTQRDDGPGDDVAEAVGDLWHPEEPWEGPSWRDLDGRARLRRIGRVVGAAAAIALALGAWSHWSTGAGGAPGGPGDTVLQQSEDLPTGLPTATSSPTSLADVAPHSPSAPAEESG